MALEDLSIVRDEIIALDEDLADQIEDLELDFIDITRAYFHADSRRPVSTMLQPEEHGPGMVGRLKKSLQNGVHRRWHLLGT